MKKVFISVLCFLIGGSYYAKAQTVASDESKVFEVDWAIKNYHAEHSDVTYKITDGVSLTMDIMASKELSGNAPTVIYVHGGNWDLGNKSWGHRPLVEDITQQIIDMNFRVISINYRLCRPTTTVTLAISDVKDAVRWVKKYGADYGVDTDNVFLMGASAGAHLSMMAALSSDDKYLGDYELKDYSSEVKGVINCYGPVDVLRPFHYRSGITVFLGSIVMPNSLFKFFEETSYNFSGIHYKESKKELREFMKAHSVQNIENPRSTPILTLHGTADKTVQPSNAKVLDKYLKSENIPSTVNYYKGVKHSFVKATKEQMNDITQSVKDFLNSYKYN